MMAEDLRKLHMAARRYCLDRHRMLYLDDPGPVITYETWARVLVLDAILADVESVTPQEFGIVGDLQSYLHLAGRTAQSPTTRKMLKLNAHYRAEGAAVEDERARFCAFIGTLEREQLIAISPLPFRHCLGRAESQWWWRVLDQRWGTTSGTNLWYPFKIGEIPGDAIAFQADWFHHALPHASLRQILSAHSNARTLALWENGDVWEIDLELLEPSYWFNKSLEVNGPTRKWTG